MTCPRCGEETGLDLGGKAFCVLCESQSRSEYSGYLVDQPGVFESHQKAVKVLSGCIAFGLLVWAAIYELVKF